MGKVSSIRLKTSDEIALMRKANLIVAEVLSVLKNKIAPGMSTFELDRIAEEHCLDCGGLPAFKGYCGFPASLCVSVNEEVVHGIPSRKRILREGDIVSLDFGVLYQGFYGDAAITLPVGRISEKKTRLLQVTEDALYKGIAQAVPGNRVSDISQAVQSYVENAGFTIVRQFVGHGVGAQLHEAPEVPNYRSTDKSSPRLLEGMVLAIEPMVNVGTHRVKILDDHWTVVTEDSQPSAHFEHSVAITATGPYILSHREIRGDDPVVC
ncbi:MAG: type I methionyl aminopeptidase [Desulfobulbaceae bacterium]|nr:type I methionyl aminopeptidase [Desulfobulbaceae bacterium]